MVLVRKYGLAAGAVVAWLGSIAFAALDIYFARQILFSILARVNRDYFQGVFYGNVLVMAGAIITVVYFIWSGEHLRKSNISHVWKFLARVYGILLIFPIVSFILG